MNMKKRPSILLQYLLYSMVTIVSIGGTAQPVIAAQPVTETCAMAPAPNDPFQTTIWVSANSLSEDGCETQLEALILTYTFNGYNNWVAECECQGGYWNYENLTNTFNPTTHVWSCETDATCILN